MTGLSRSHGVAGKGLRTDVARYIGTMDRRAEIATDSTQFEAVIVPHRSLSPRGLRILIGVICLLSGLIVLRFWFIGAWPVAGFSVLEIGLAIFLLRLNTGRARASELILLSDDSLRIVRTGTSGRQEERVLPVGWLNVVLEERPGRVPKLLLVTRGLREEIAAALGEAEKRSLWSALREAVHRMRNPRFHNPQLQDEGGSDDVERRASLRARRDPSI
jgi:uncharacterized membrane protein